MKKIINYIDTDKLTITFSALIFNVESINAKFGDLSAFVEKFDLYGKTNGKLYILIEMNQPPYYLYEMMDTKLAPFNFKRKIDYVFTYERYVDDSSEEGRVDLNKELPESEGVPWLGSFVKLKGNYVWYINEEERKINA